MCCSLVIRSSSYMPVAAPAANVIFGTDTVDQLGIKDHLDAMKEATGKLLEGELKIERPELGRRAILSEQERSGVLALHSFLRQHDRHHERLGLKRVPTYSGDFLWLCPTHFDKVQSKIPDVI